MIPTASARRNVCVAIVLGITGIATRSIHATDVAGDQSGVWTAAGSPYVLVGDVTVPPGATLVIEPGVTVLGPVTRRLTVEEDATLLAIGTPARPILLSAQDTIAGWRGVRLEAASDATTFSHCIFEYARGSGVDPTEVKGGALKIRDCSPLVSHSEFRFNTSQNIHRNGSGGGICIESSSALIIDNFIHDNMADSGGGITTRAFGTEATILRNRIVDNTARHSGGGIYIGNVTAPVIAQNVILRNETGLSGSGGGLTSWGSSATIHDNLIAYNKARLAGGGLYCRYDDVAVTNNTIVHNDASAGGGIYVLNQSGDPPRVTNCILRGNTALNGPQIWLYKETGSAITTLYSAVEGGWPGEGNIAADPVFVDPLGADGLAGTDDDDFRLADASPAIDAGSNLELPADVIEDLDGNARRLDDPDTEDTGRGTPPLVDMGAFEHQPAGCVADVDGDGDVGFAETLAILRAWGPCPACPEDIDGDGAVGFSDVHIVLTAWGPCAP